MSTKPYLKGPSGVLKADSNWLGVADLPWDKDTKVTIEHAITISGERMSQSDLVSGGGLKFQGKKKQWKLPACCHKQLDRLFTNEVANWVGQEITLYVDTSVMAFGVNTGGIRIRDKAADAMRQRATEIAAPAPEDATGAGAEPSSEFSLDNEGPAICEGTWGMSGGVSEGEACELDAGHTGHCGPKDE